MQNLEWYLADLKFTGKNTIETVEKSLTDMFIRLVRIYPCLYSAQIAEIMEQIRPTCNYYVCCGRGPRVVVSTAAFHARVRGSVPGLSGLKETKMFLPHPRIVGSLRDRKVACSASERQGSNFESSVWRTVSSLSSHYPREVLLAQFNLYTKVA